MSRFTHIQLRNWRNFKRVDVDLQARVFLVGPNASGKSNFLDVFRFLHDLASVGGGLQEAVRRRGGISKLRCLASRRDSDIAIRATLQETQSDTEWEYELVFYHKEVRVRRERVFRNGEMILNRPDLDDERDPERLTQTHLEQVIVNQAFRAVANFFASVQYLHIVPQLIREPDRSVGKVNDPYGGDFLEQVAQISQKRQRARLKRIKDALEVAVPQLAELRLERDSRGTPHLQGRYEHWRPRGAWQDESQFSDGTLRLMGLLWVAQDSEGPLLLEEPELSLHPEIVRVIPQTFARIQRDTGRQILISTHSSEMLRDDGIGLDETLLFLPRSEGTEVHPAGSFDEIRHLLEAGLTMADAVMPATRPPDVDQLPLFADKP